MSVRLIPARMEVDVSMASMARGVTVNEGSVAKCVTGVSQVSTIL